MSSNVKRDHHTFTRDTITSRNTSSVTVEAQDHLNIQVGKSDGGTALSLLTLKDGAGNNVFYAGNLVDSVVPLQINEPGTGTDNFAITVYANGASAITTTDAAGTDAYLKIKPDGYTQIDGTDLRLAYDDDDYHQITVASDGDITFKAYNDGSQNTAAGFNVDEAQSVRFANKTLSDAPTFFIDNNKDDATGPKLKLRNARFDSGVQQAGEDGDVCGTIFFSANDDSPTYTDFGSIVATIVDASNGSERGQIDIKVAEYDGTLTTGLALNGTGTDGEVDINIGAGTASMTSIAGHLSLPDNGKLYLGTSTDNDYITSDGSDILIKKNDITRVQLSDTQLYLNYRSTSFTSTATESPTITIESDVDDATSGKISFAKDRGGNGTAGQDNDEIGIIEFSGRDDSGSGWITYGKMITTISDASDTAEGGKLELQVASHDGEVVTGLKLQDGSLEDEIDVTIASGDSSNTNIAGHLNVATGQINLGADQRFTLGDNDDYLYGDGTNVHISKDDSEVMTFFDTVVRTLVDAEFSGDITATNSTSTKPILTLKNTTNDTNGSSIKFLKDKGAAGANSDVIGSLTFYGDNDAQQETQFASIVGSIQSAADGAEGGELAFNLASHDGEIVTGLSITDGSEEDEVDVAIASGTSSRTTVAGALTMYGETFTLQNATASHPQMLIRNINDDANGGNIHFYKNSTSTADNDSLGTITWGGDNDNLLDVPVTPCRIDGQFLDVSDGAEKGRINLDVAEYDGTLTTGVTVFGTATNGQVDVTLGASATSTIGFSGKLQVPEISSPSAPADGAGGYLYTKTDGKPYWISNEVSETDLSASGGGGSTTEFYDIKVCNFYTSSTNNQFIPFTSYLERDSIAAQNDYVTIVAPYNGTVERIMFRSEIPQNGTLEFDIFESSDGTETPGTIIGVKDTSINIADDITITVDFDSMTSGTNVVTKGRIYAIQINTPSAPYDTNVTVVFKWDVTT